MTGRMKKRIALLVGVLAVLSAGVAGAYAVKQSHVKTRMAESLRDGMAAYKAGEYQKTMDTLGYYIGHNNKDGAAILAMGDARSHVPLENGKHILDAIRLIKLAAENMPGNPEPLQKLLDLYNQAGFMTERLRVADQLLAINPTDSSAMNARVVSLARQGQYDNALEAARKLAEAHPDDLQAHRFVVELMTTTKQSPDAIREYVDKAAAPYRDKVRFIVLQSEVYAKAGDVDAAIAAGKRAAAAPIDSAEGVSELVRLLDILARVDPSLVTAADAVMDREMHTALAPSVATIATERAWKSGRADTARESARKIVSLDNLPGATDAALGWWGFLEVGGGRSAEDPNVKKVLAELASRTGPEAGYWTNIIQGTIFLNANQLTDASRVLTIAQTFGPAGDLPVYLTADVQQRMGEWRPAVKAWQSLSRAQPSWRMLHIAIVSVLLQHERYQEAAAEAELGLGAHPDFAEAMSLGRALAMVFESNQMKPEQATRSITVADGLEGGANADPAAMALVARLNYAGGKDGHAEEVIRGILASETPATADVLISLAAAVRPHNAALSDEVLARANAAGGDTPALVYVTAIQQADAGHADQGRKLLEAAIERHKSDQPLAYQLRLAAFLDHIKDPGAGEAFNRIASEHAKDSMAQLALLESESAWKNESCVSGAISRLHELTGEAGVAWKINTAKKRLVFSPTQPEASLAVTELGEVLRLDPGNIGAMVLTAEANLVLGDRRGAIEKMAQAVDAQPDSGTFYPRLIELLQQDGRSDEASRRLALFANINNLTPDTKRRRADLLAAQGMWDLAAADYRDLAKAGAAEDRFSLASTLSRSGEIAGAREIFDALSQSTGLTEPVVVSIADFYASQGEVDKGRGLIERLLPPDAQTHKAALLGAYLERFGRLADAEQQYQAQAADGKIESLTDLAKFFYKRGRNGEAKTLVEKGLATAPENAQLRQLSSFINMSNGGSSSEALAEIARTLDSSNAHPALKRLAQAMQNVQKNPSKPEDYVKELEAIAAAYPSFFPGWKFLVEARLSMGQGTAAVDTARRAVKSSPVDARPARLATMAMIATGQLDEALVMAREWKRRETADPFDPDLAIAAILSAQKHPEDALRQVQPWKSRILADLTTAPDHFQQYATLLAGAGQSKAAEDLVWPLADQDRAWGLRCLQIAEGLSPPTQDRWMEHLRPLVAKDPAGNLAYGRVLLMIADKQPSKERYDRAIEVLRGALDDSQFRPAAALRLASAYEASGNRVEAIRHYRIAVEATPDDAVTLNNLAVLLSADAGTSEEAVKLAKHAVDLSATMAPSLRISFLDTLGVAQLKAQKWADAEASFKEALKLDPGSLDELVGLAEARLPQGSTEEAMRAVAQADQRPPGIPKGPVDARVDALRQNLPK